MIRAKASPANVPALIGSAKNSIDEAAKAGLAAGVLSMLRVFV